MTTPRYWRPVHHIQIEWHPPGDTWEPLSIREGRRPRPFTLRLGPVGRIVVARLSRAC